MPCLHSHLVLSHADRAMACSTMDHPVDDIDHVRTDRTALSDQPPTLQPFDVQLRQISVSSLGRSRGRKAYGDPRTSSGSSRSSTTKPH